MKTIDLLLKLLFIININRNEKLMVKGIHNGN